jgi:acyl carrier protein
VRAAQEVQAQAGAGRPARARAFPFRADAGRIHSCARRGDLLETNPQILAKLRELLADKFEVDPARITPEADLYRDLDLDSIDAVDLVIKLQEMTGRRIKPENSAACAPSATSSWRWTACWRLRSKLDGAFLRAGARLALALGYPLAIYFALSGSSRAGSRPRRSR